MGFCAIAALTAITDSARADCTPGNTGTAGSDHISCDRENDAEGADVDALGGDDTLDINGTNVGAVYAGEGDDTINIGSENATDISNPEDINLDDVTTINNVYAGEGDDTVFIKKGAESDFSDLDERDFNNRDAAEELADEIQVDLHQISIENLIDTGSGNDTIIVENRLSRIGDVLNGGGIDSGSGDDTIELLDGLVIHVWSGIGNDSIILDGGFVFNYIDAGEGDDIIYWDEGIANEVRGGTGSDDLTIDAAAYENGPILDGGDDVHTGDGYVDTLTFILDHEQDGRLLRNWERIVVWGSSTMRFFGALNVGGGVDTGGTDLGLDILFGGVVQFIPRNFNVTGNIANAGTLDLDYNNRFDTLTLSKDADGNYGNYIGKGGRLWLDVRLNGDGSPADQFKVAGDTSGRTFIRVTNRGGIGAATSGDGIKLVEIDGNSPADAFVLDGDFVAKDGQPAAVGGAYAYTLHHSGKADPGDGDWYLRSLATHPEYLEVGEAPRWQPAAVMYETYPQLLRSLNQPASLRSRVGNRFWMGSSYKDVNNCNYDTSVERSIDGGGAWVRASARQIDVDPMESTTYTRWEQDYFRLQLGVDVPLNFTVMGTQPIASVALHYGDSENDLESFYGDGNIDVKGYGVSSFMTWYGTRGTYFDAQLLLNWFESDITAFDLRDLTKGEDAFGYAFSVEAGRSFKLRNLYSITPQAQLVYSKEEADDFHDSYDVKVTDINNNGFLARIGATIEKRATRRKSGPNMYGELPLERFSFYVTPSAIYNIDQESHINVSNTTLYQQPDDWLGELVLGATYDECGDRCSVYGEIYLTSSLENFGDSTGGGLVFGFRYKW
ncbi:autotransporter outer membrane beta-barrel domain-containing protein [Microbulbifer magnicolonia]|uniref:autotransporter family protein n=1 Tax=Microbulbifer magnicolonia TaxID=3109744 RepID=UPI002B4062BA|nr:autotransporter outer membrane beta-barrel domain-containing protein [Microbulbifer sp. GG15]